MRHDDDLQTYVERALGDLPGPAAPPTLLPRVMAAVQALRERPWYTRAWLTWPFGLQLASASLLIAAIAGLALLLPDVRPAIASLAGGASPDAVERVLSTADAVAATGARVETTASAMVLVSRTVLAPAMFYSVALVLLMAGMCAAFGTALHHVALGKVIPR